MNQVISTIRCLLPGVLVALTACAPLAPQQTEYPAGRVRLALPAGAWEDLGASDQAVRLLPQPDGRIALQTRVVGLRGAHQELLAVLRVQANRSNDWQGPMLWTGSCLPQQGVAVEDATVGSRVRMDCLRFKRWMNDPQWLEKNQPDLAQWLAGHKLAVSAPYSYMSYRYATEGGAMVAVDVLADRRLLHPWPRNNEEFLVAGRPALQWGQQLAQAVRVSTGMMDGYLAIPPFPYAASVP